jgi:S1-C subfamily serine protease
MPARHEELPMTIAFRLMFALPLLCCAVAATAIAHGGARDRDGSYHEEQMDWRQDGKHLRMKSGADGVQVQQANTLRLHDGDTITALGTQPVRTPRALIDGLQARQGHSVALQVRAGDGNTRTVRWSPGEYADLSPPAPPPPAPRP